jgi:hypothetical protein
MPDEPADPLKPAKLLSAARVGSGARVTLPVHLLVRTSVDWRSMDADKFAAQEDETRPTRWIRYASMRDLLGVWDQAFKLPFLDYRAELADLAAETHARAGADVLSVGLDHVAPHASYEQWWASTDDEAVVTIDDDDFFQPDLGALAAEFVDGVDLVLWPQAIFRFNERGTLKFKWAPLPIVLQTNWAIRKSFLTANFSPEDGRQMLAHHPIANEMLADHLGVGRKNKVLYRFRNVLEDSRVRFVEPSYGLYNAHMGSISFLIKVLREQPDPVAYLRSLDFTIPPVPEYIAGLEPYVERLGELWSSMSRP